MVKVGTTPGMTGCDLNCAIYTASGDVAVSGIGVYAHALSGQGPIKYFKKYYAESVGINDGDLFFVSDPYIGGTHVNDQFLVAPIFHEGQIVAWVSAGCHQAEIGAVDVGMSPSARNRFADGMNCTTIKIGENMIMRDDLVCALANMGRDPQSWILDVKARYAAIVHMRKEMLKMVRERGSKYVVGGLRKLIEDTGKLAGKKFAAINDGTYRTVAFIDTLGDRDALLRICVTVTKKGDKVYMDYTGTSPQIPGAMNAYSFGLPGTLVMYGMPYFFYDIPTSIGVLAPIEEYKIANQCLLNADANCSVSMGVISFFSLNIAIHTVFTKMIFDSPDRVAVASSQGWAIDGFQAVFVNQRGLRNSTMIMDINAFGQGGREKEDGPNSMNPPWAAVADCLETEWYEKDMPFLFLFRKHPKNGGGNGKYRGGMGIESGFVVREMPGGMMTTVGGAAKCVQAPGVFGGYASVCGPGLIAWESDFEKMIEKGEKVPQSRFELIEQMKGKVSVLPKFVSLREFHNGDIITVQNPGGGGYGDALERDPEMVMNDLRVGAIDDWVAENVYKVAYDKENILLDVKRTEELRKEARRKRAKLGKKYDAFIKEWSKLRPPKEVLTYFGPWEIKDCQQ
jgi:acetophenone carboxylase